MQAKSAWTTPETVFESIHAEARISIGVLYLVMAAVIAWRQRANFRPLLRDGLVVPVAELVASAEPEANRHD